MDKRLTRPASNLEMNVPDLFFVRNMFFRAFAAFHSFRQRQPTLPQEKVAQLKSRAMRSKRAAKQPSGTR
ncbi:hypothetical protein [Bradyrhizobium sp. HKCCYLR20261]|uniref:hypothetical protein n=1 Tax=Bradyrhizobium sp. HKCCYLR20261 TaxID=3420760 RepID=UPI003EBF23C0